MTQACPSNISADLQVLFQYFSQEGSCDKFVAFISQFIGFAHKQLVLTSVLGMGASAYGLLFTEQKSKKKFVLKLFVLSIPADTQLKIRVTEMNILKREYDILVKLNVNKTKKLQIPKVYGLKTITSSYRKNFTIGFIMMEFIKSDLDQNIYEGACIHKKFMLRQTNLTLSKVQHIIIDVLDSIEELHETGYVHLDLSGENIILKKKNDSYVPVLIDFGNARSLKDFDESLRPLLRVYDFMHFIFVSVFSVHPMWSQPQMRSLYRLYNHIVRQYLINETMSSVHLEINGLIKILLETCNPETMTLDEMNKYASSKTIAWWKLQSDIKIILKQ
jgi:serine/threonine protein kinase